MAETDASYQTKIGREQEAERFFIREDGEFKFFDEDFRGGILRSLAQQTKVYTITNYSTAATTLSDHGGSSPPVLPSGYGTIRIEASDGGTNLSARLASAYSGQELNLVLMAGSVASVLIYFSGHASGISGVNVIGLMHSAGASALSSISMRQSAGSFARVKMRALDTLDWAIVEINSVDNVTERRA